MTVSKTPDAPRPMAPPDLVPLAQLWFDGWVEAHADHVPDELIALRTLASFKTRLTGFEDGLRVAGPIGAPLGFCAIRDEKLDQLYVSPRARGSGLAATLLSDGEARLAAKGVRRAKLICLIENTRAAHFYERQGWANKGPSDEVLQTLDGPYPFRLLRFEKTV